MKINAWLWPDMMIGKRESRRLREEHNALVNAHTELLEREERIIKGGAESLRHAQQERDEARKKVDPTKIMIQLSAAMQELIAAARAAFLDLEELNAEAESAEHTDTGRVWEVVVPLIERLSKALRPFDRMEVS